MTYEEKRELRLQISQLLADAGLNQKVIKEMVVEEVKNKVERAVNQEIKKLDAESSSGNFVKDKIMYLLTSNAYSCRIFEKAVKEELSNHVIQVVLKDVEKI